MYKCINTKKVRIASINIALAIMFRRAIIYYRFLFSMAIDKKCQASL